MKKHMDHNGYPKSLRSKNVVELMFIAKDAKEAADANPDGINSGYYLDEMHYASMELKRRQS